MKDQWMLHAESMYPRELCLKCGASAWHHWMAYGKSTASECEYVPNRLVLEEYDRLVLREIKRLVKDGPRNRDEDDDKGVGVTFITVPGARFSTGFRLNPSAHPLFFASDLAVGIVAPMRNDGSLGWFGFGNPLSIFNSIERRALTTNAEVEYYERPRIHLPEQVAFTNVYDWSYETNLDWEPILTAPSVPLVFRTSPPYLPDVIWRRERTDRQRRTFPWYSGLIRPKDMVSTCCGTSGTPSRSNVPIDNMLRRLTSPTSGLTREDAVRLVRSLPMKTEADQLADAPMGRLLSLRLTGPRYADAWRKIHRTPTDALLRSTTKEFRAAFRQWYNWPDGLGRTYINL